MVTVYGSYESYLYYLTASREVARCNFVHLTFINSNVWVHFPLNL